MIEVSVTARWNSSGVRYAPTLTAVGEDIGYGYVGTRAYSITRNYLNVGPVPDIPVPDCDGDECAYVCLVIVFVVLTIMLVVGAALIPHMWVLSGLVLHEVRQDRSLQEQFGRDVRRAGSAY